MNRNDVYLTGLGLKKLFEPYCEKFLIAGSVRREVPEVKDLELVIVPKTSVEQRLLGVEGSVEGFYRWAASQTHIDWIKPGVAQIERNWPVKPNARYLRGMFSGSDDNGLKIDIFIANRDNYGAIATMRTGSNHFTHALMIRGIQVKKRCKGGYLTNSEGTPIETPYEKDFFEELGLEWLAPHKRNPKTLEEAHQMVAELRK